MLNLIVKDILIQKKYLIFAIFYFLFLFFVFAKSSFLGFIYFFAVIATVYMIVTTAVDCDEKSALLLNSLPVKRQEIVLAKYCSAFVYAALALLVIALLTGSIFPSLRLPITFRSLTIGDIAGALAGTALFCSYYFPLYFKLGASRIRYVNLLVFISLISATGLLLDLCQYHPYRVIFLLSAIRQVPLWQLASTITLALLVILLSSLFISLRFYENRDL